MCLTYFDKNRRANENTNKMIFVMLGEPEGWIHADVRAVQKDNIAGTSSPKLMAIKHWTWLMKNTTTIIPALIDIANDYDDHGNSRFRTGYAGDLYTYLAPFLGRESTVVSEVNFGPWDTNGDDRYDSGMCLGGHQSDHLIDGMCPIYDACT